MTVKLRFEGNLQELQEGIHILKEILTFDISEEGIEIAVEQRVGNIEICLEKGKGTIIYDKKIHFFRALGLFIKTFRKKEKFHIVEKPHFTMNGAMIDASRNAVMTVKSIKKALHSIALMGLNVVMLYTEDTYEIDQHSYFGYMRGRYTQKELKACDDYAEIFGIEIIPCIQTLAHLTQALKWKCADELRDTEDILLVGSKKTYEFIEAMIKAASAPFRSKRIHIGIDEAHNLGLGKYLDTNGYRRRFDIMNEHLGKVVEIVTKQGLEPMLWSDMYFRLASKKGLYYDRDAIIPHDVIEAAPKNAQLVYWDYYHNDKETYVEFIRRHQRFGSNPIFAGGIWTWAGISTNYRKTFITTNAALQACKEEGVKEVFATLWGDNGRENQYYKIVSASPIG